MSRDRGADDRLGAANPVTRTTPAAATRSTTE